MAQAHVEIKIGAAVGLKKLSAVQQAIQPAVLLKLIGLRFMAFVDESFVTSGRGKWAPLRPITLLLRKRGGSKPLMDTGAHYRPSFVVKTDNTTYAEIGSSAKNPDGSSMTKVHEFGAIIRAKRSPALMTKASGAFGLTGNKVAGRWVIFGKQVTIPARPVLPTRAEAEVMVRETVEAALVRASQVK